MKTKVTYTGDKFKFSLIGHMAEIVDRKKGKVYLRFFTGPGVGKVFECNEDEFEHKE